MALPALAASRLGAAPGAGVWLAVVAALLFLAWVRAARADGPSGGFARQLRSAALGLGLGGVGVLAASTALAALARVPYEARDERAAAIFDLDASIPTRAIPSCAAQPAQVLILLDRGARPRFGDDGRWLWFDARVEGRRQIHRLDTGTGQAVCWTCDEPGNNLRPAPAGRGSGVAFETDRHGAPWATEIHVADGRGEAPRSISRRLTFGAGPDDHALLRHGVLVWSRRESAGYEVVSAGVRSGHGSLGLGDVSVLSAGGTNWIAPLEWSPDGRSLVLARGNPFRPRVARAIDPATGVGTLLGEDVAPGGASFNADGGWVVVASPRRARLAGLLPPQLGFLLAPLAVAIEREGPLLRGTGIRMGEPWAPGAPLELGDLAVWGEPTGIALSPDASHVILGQRSAAGDERLVRLDLDCR